jgi:hypothetical protein
MALMPTGPKRLEGTLTHLASTKLSLDLDWNNQSPRMCVAFLPPSVGVIKSKGLNLNALEDEDEATALACERRIRFAQDSQLVAKIPLQAI